MINTTGALPEVGELTVRLKMAWRVSAIMTEASAGGYDSSDIAEALSV
ncbi:MAG: hypothetical protein ACU0BJ_10860 [Shimia sp.]